MRQVERVKAMRVKAKELKDYLFSKELSVKKVRIALQVIPMMMQQASSARANNMQVKEFKLDEIVQKDSDYDIYREITQMFNEEPILDASEVLNGMYQDMHRALEKEADEKNISEVDIDIL